MTGAELPEYPDSRPDNVQKSTDRPFDWDDARVFATLADAGSLGAAARRLGVEHSTVARRIDALERALGLRLFDRLPRAWTLTDAGAVLRAHATRMGEEADALRLAAAGTTTDVGRVRLSAPPTFASRFLLPRLAPQLAAWPRLELEIVAESRESQLHRHESDLALRLGRPGEEGLAARRLGALGFGLYASAAYLATHARDAWRRLGYDASLAHVPQQRWLDAQLPDCAYALRSNDQAVVWQACCAGLGVAVLPHFLAASDRALVRIETLPCPIRRELWLVLHPQLRRTPRVRRVADLVAAVVAEAQAEL